MCVQMVNACLCEVYNVVSFSLIDLMNDYATSAMTIGLADCTINIERIMKY